MKTKHIISTFTICLLVMFISGCFKESDPVSSISHDKFVNQQISIAESKIDSLLNEQESIGSDNSQVRNSACDWINEAAFWRGFQDFHRNLHDGTGGIGCDEFIDENPQCSEWDIIGFYTYGYDYAMMEWEEYLKDRE